MMHALNFTRAMPNLLILIQCPNLITTTTTLLFFFLFLFLIGGRHHRLPPGPRGIPILGALPLIGPMAHESLYHLSTRYGPIMYLKMGTSNVVVASTSSAARTFLKSLDLQFANRPDTISIRQNTYDRRTMVFSDYGPRWKHLRKLVNVHMLGPKALSSWSDVRSDEIGRMIQSMHQLAVQALPIPLLEMMICTNANMIGRVVFTRRVLEPGESSSEFKDTIMELLTGIGLFNIGDFIPSIAWMDLQGVLKRLNRAHRRIDSMLMRVLSEHAATSEGRMKRPDFLDMIRMKKKEGEEKEEMSETDVKALIRVWF